MVNYCCVQGCSRNSRTNKHLHYYSTPKEEDRKEQWLRAAGRSDLLEKSMEKRTTHRICSRHFTPSSMKNKHLCPDAVPTLFLPGSNDADSSDDSDDEPTTHHYIVCNSCKASILGFRYKCIVCPDYDLCPKCEIQETHSEHFMCRIPKPVKFKLVDDFIQKCREIYEKEHSDLSVQNDYDTSDDEPIIKRVKNYDSGIDLSDDVKSLIQDEVTRVLNLKIIDADVKKKDNTKRRSGAESERLHKKQKINPAPEMAFADVNEIDSICSVKTEMANLNNN